MGPNTIILDSRQLVHKLHQILAQCGPGAYAPDTDWFLVDLVQEIVERLRNRTTAERLLQELRDEIAVGACPCGGDYVPPEFAPTVYQLGKVLLEQLDALHAYNFQHHLPYHFYANPQRSDNQDVTLVRTQELPP